LREDFNYNKCEKIKHLGVSDSKYLISGGTVVSWSKDGQVLSADNVKVLNDDRIYLDHQPKHGVNIAIVGRTLVCMSARLTLTRRLFMLNISCR
jgi:hypothetical protein